VCLRLELLLALGIFRGEKQVPPENSFRARGAELPLKVRISLQQLQEQHRVNLNACG